MMAEPEPIPHRRGAALDNAVAVPRRLYPWAGPIMAARAISSNHGEEERARIQAINRVRAYVHRLLQFGLVNTAARDAIPWQARVPLLYAC